MGISPGALHAESTPRNTCVTTFDTWLPGLLASCSYTLNGLIQGLGFRSRGTRAALWDPQSVVAEGQTDPHWLPPHPGGPGSPGSQGRTPLSLQVFWPSILPQTHAWDAPSPLDGLLIPQGGDQAPFSRRRSCSFWCWRGLGVLSSWSSKAVREAIDLKDNITCFQSL